ncbi:MAG: hypothetical protein IPO56_16840 [Flavobacteriales bacterium]|nr:hypothetical protein [Flavobacteriales bacterium]
MAELGYRKVVTTPHNMADGYKNTPDDRLGGLERVRDEVRQRGIAIEVDAAAEYYLDHELEKKVADRKILTFGQEMVLFELPFISEPNMLLESRFPDADRRLSARACPPGTLRLFGTRTSPSTNA